MGQQPATWRRRGLAAGGALAAAVALGACGSQVDGPADDAGGTSEDPTGVYTGQGMAIETADGAGPQLCLGPVAESFPPQCEGVALVGLDWDDVPGRQSASGVTWGQVEVVGRYDGQSFTLTEEPAEPTLPVEPDGGAGGPELEQLCDNPYDGGEEGFVPQTEDEMLAMDRFGLLLEGYDGYVGSWVSDGFSVFNVLVTGDPEPARETFREEWPGGLCVEQREDAATAAELREAQDALGAAGIDGLQSSGAGPTGVLDVAVVVADERTTQAVLEAVSPWLTPEQVDLQGALTPVSSAG
jgi:hypothetical protein